MSRPPASPAGDDLWARFRGATRARIGLERAGDAMVTRDVLALQLAHARARDAVHGRVDFAALAVQIEPLESLLVHSAAPDRATYLTRPDLGRRLDAASHARLLALKAAAAPDVVIVVADGLSAAAVERNAIAVLKAVLRRLGGLAVGPVVFAAEGRVALGDEIGACLGARLVVELIGERPGLSSPDSLGAYLTFAPRTGRLDAERNCVSNIHADGLSPEAAADKITWLAKAALERGLTGVGLKEDAGPALPGAAGAALPPRPRSE